MQFATYYRDHYPLTEAARQRVDLNPGNGSVSRLTHEFQSLGRGTGGHARAVCRQRTTHRSCANTSRFPRLRRAIASPASQSATCAAASTAPSPPATFSMPPSLAICCRMAKVEYVTGAESQKQTGEMHAAAERAACGQPILYLLLCYGLSARRGSHHRAPGKLFRLAKLRPEADAAVDRPPASVGPCAIRKRSARAQAFFDPEPKEPGRAGLNLWTYRRIADRANFTPGAYKSSITLVNWPQNDFWLGDLVTASPADRPALLERAKQLSLSFLYWMQTEPREAGRDLRLRKDIVDTEDGLAKTAYIRESRRIKAEFTILEKHVGAQMRNSRRAAEVFRRFGRHRLLPHRPAPLSRRHELYRREFAALSDSARRTDPETRGEPAAGLQKHRRDPYHQWMLSAASGRVEYRRSSRRACRSRHRDQTNPAIHPQHSPATCGISSQAAPPGLRTRVAPHTPRVGREHAVNRSRANRNTHRM